MPITVSQMRAGRRQHFALPILAIAYPACFCNAGHGFEQRVLAISFGTPFPREQTVPTTPRPLRTTMRFADGVHDASERTRQLAEDAENIRSIVDVIRGIAKQIHLLALNAAIEAARAGEGGRGFAIVANEVRTLAERTQASTDEIQQRIEQLNRGVHQVLEVMQTCIDRADRAPWRHARYYWKPSRLLQRQSASSTAKSPVQPLSRAWSAKTSTEISSTPCLSDVSSDQ
ncbi:hypothetical protein CKO23_19670 [Thiocystis violacea]|nr:hypothetical protein [Thiocystis violacea]